VSWIQVTDLIATTRLNGRGLQSTVEWEGELSGKPITLPNDVKRVSVLIELAEAERAMFNPKVEAC
jgi:hypothetical protein